MKIDEVLQDAELTLAAKAAYLLILRHHDTGGATFEDIKVVCADRPNDLNTALNTLRQRGYVRRVDDRYLHA